LNEPSKTKKGSHGKYQSAENTAIFVAGDSFINASFYIFVSQSCVAAGSSLSTILSGSTAKEGFEGANLSIK